jgi:hypothetical protein
MVNFSHIDGLMKVPFDMVDEPIDTFIQTGKRRWDLGCLKFDRDLVYDIEGKYQARCWLWSLIIFLIQRSLFSVMFIPHEDFTP